MNTVSLKINYGYSISLIMKRIYPSPLLVFQSPPTIKCGLSILADIRACNGFLIKQVKTVTVAQHVSIEGVLEKACFKNIRIMQKCLLPIRTGFQQTKYHEKMDRFFGGDVKNAIASLKGKSLML